MASLGEDSIPRGTCFLPPAILRLLLSVAASALTSVLLFLSYPNGSLGWLAWMALVPLLTVLSVSRPITGLFLAYLSGVLGYALIFYWLFEVPGYTPLHHVMLTLYMGSFLTLFGFGVSFIAGRLGQAAALAAAPFLWVSLEYLRANMPVMAAPWPVLGYSQHAHPWVIQIAAIGGVYGISFLLVSVNSSLAALLLMRVLKSERAAGLSSFPVSVRGVSAIGGISAFLVLISLSYGAVVCSRSIREGGNPVTISLVQGNIDQDKKWDPKLAGSIMQIYRELTEQAAKDKPALIVWPEAATPRSIIQSPNLYSEVRQLARRTGANLFLGSTSQVKFKKEGENSKYHNSGFLIGPPAGEPPRYDKIVLFPFGEYLPLKEIMPWHRLGVPNMGSYKPGEDYKVFDCPGFRFGATICWENGFPGLVRQFVRRGAQFIVNITNEAWFGRTASPYQFLTYNVLRAVENRRYIVRCSNTGVSCVIDPWGQVVDRVKDDSGKDIFVRGYLTEKVFPIDYETIYTRFGDWPAWMSVSGVFAFGLWALLRRRHPDAAKT